MSHHIYQTDALVLSYKNTGEANRYYQLFTKELGLVNASAQSIRHLKSKLRYSLQIFSYSHIGLVRGKNIWRLIKAEPILVLELTKNLQKRVLVARVFSLLIRLLRGEGENKRLFDEVILCLLFLEKNNFTKQELDIVEVILVMRILNSLGYWGKHNKLDVFLVRGEWSFSVTNKMKEEKNKAIVAINKAIKETQL